MSGRIEESVRRSFLYRLSPAGESLFPRRYEEALGHLLERLVEREGREDAVQLLQGYFDTHTRRLAAALDVRRRCGSWPGGLRWSRIASRSCARLRHGFWQKS